MSKPTTPSSTDTNTINFQKFPEFFELAGDVAEADGAMM